MLRLLTTPGFPPTRTGLRAAVRPCARPRCGPSGLFATAPRFFESTQRACPGGEPPGYPPLSLDASFSFRRPKQDGLPVPSAAYGLVRVCFRRYSAPSRAPTRVKKLGLGVRSTYHFPGLCRSRRPPGCLRFPKACRNQGIARRGNLRTVGVRTPESCCCTSTDAFVPLKGVLRGLKAWRVGRPLARSSRLFSP